jgi:3-oxoadipate enol-lactonase
MTPIRGVDLEVQDTGAGTAILWGHGFSSCMRDDDAARLIDWERLAAGHRLVRWDARGHGGSGGTSEPVAYRWDELASDALAIADSLGIDRLIAAGVSMGAATALHAAVRAPSRVAGLVLVLPPTAYETRPAQAAIYASGAHLVEAEGVDAYVTHLNDQPAPAILGAFAQGFRIVPAVADHLLPVVLRGAAASDLPAQDEVRKLDQPTLILAWAGDPGHPVSTAETLANLLRCSELVVAEELRDLRSWTGRVEAFVTALAS